MENIDPLVSGHQAFSTARPPAVKLKFFQGNKKKGNILTNIFF
jgi:hypothetical protein